MGFFDSLGDGQPTGDAATQQKAMDPGGRTWTGNGAFDQEPGLGFSQYSTDVYRPGSYSFRNPDANKNRDLLAQYFNGLGNRGAPQMNAATAGMAYTSSNPYLAPAATYGGATIDTAGSDEARKYQLGLMNQLQLQASGNAPSLAELQMKQGLQQNLQQQASLAGSMGGGGNPALAMRNLQYGAAAQNQQLLGQAGAARLQEQMLAEQQLGGVASGMRAQDIGLASQQAQLAQQAGLANMGAENQFSLANAGFEQQNSLANAQMKNQFALQNAGWQQQAGMSNLQAQMGLLGLNQQGQTWALGQQLGMSEADRQAAMNYEQMMMQSSIAQNEIAQKSFQDAAKARAGMFGGIMGAAGGALALSDEREKENVQYEGLTLSPIDEKTNVADESSMSRTSMGDSGPSYGQVLAGNMLSGLGAGMAGAEPQYAKFSPAPSSSGLPVPDAGNPEGAALGTMRGTFAQGMADLQQRNQQRMASGSASDPNADSGGGGLFGGGGGLGGILSDEDEKSGVKKGASGQLLDPLTPYSYNYKDPSMPGAAPGRQLGIMAQDLERSKFGAQAVVDTPQGKMVDYAKLQPPMLAAQADMHKRLAVIESSLGIGAAHAEGDTTEKPKKKKAK